MNRKNESISSWRESAKNKLTGISEDPGMEVDILLSRSLHVDRAWAIAHPEFIMDSSQLNIIDAQLNQRALGIPLPYILGSWDFWGKSFLVGPEVLIPRPETEILVEAASDWLKHHSVNYAIDIGTGSGCIALSLAEQFPNIQWLASDLSHCALLVAQKNAHILGLSNIVRFLQMDLLSCIDTKFDLICANLPYIPHERLSSLAVSRTEPLLALDGGKSGISLISTLIESLPGKINPGGLVLLEIDHTQADLIPKLLIRVLPELKISVINDLAHHPRVIKAELQSL